LYECACCGARATVGLGFGFEAIYEVDLLEENPRLLPLRDGMLKLTFKPFEIKTLRVVIK